MNIYMRAAVLTSHFPRHQAALGLMTGMRQLHHANNIRFETLQMSDVEGTQATVDLAAQMCMLEPIGKHFNFTLPSMLEFANDAVPFSASRNMLTVARDTSNNNKVVGLIISKPFLPAKPGAYGTNFQDGLTILRTLIQDLHEYFLKTHVWGCERHERTSEDSEELKNISRLELVAVHPEYSGRGISKQMVKANLEQLAKLGYRSAIVECTGIFSLKACKHNGFQPVKQIMYSDYVMKDGSKPLQGMAAGIHKAIELLHVKLTSNSEV